MNVFFRNLKSRVGLRAFRIFKLYAIHELQKAEIGRRLNLHRGNVGRQITKVCRAAKALLAAMGLDQNLFSFTLP